MSAHPESRRKFRLRLFAGLVLLTIAGLAIAAVGWFWLRGRPELTVKLDRAQATAEYHLLKWTSSYRQEGEEIYNIHCASCHAKDGSGGRGSDLRRSPAVVNGSPHSLYTIIRVGRMNRGMPLFSPELIPTSDAYKLIAYMENLGQSAPEEVRGDVKAGELLYRGKGKCSVCHVIGSEPPTGLLAYDLTGIGGRRSRAYLRESLVSPNADLNLEQRPVTVLTAAGQTLNGVLLREDTFQVILRDGEGRTHSFDKEELRLIEIPERSAMPSYSGVFSESELVDLVAFLQSLR